MNVAWLLLVVLFLVGAWIAIREGSAAYRRAVAQAEADKRGEGQ